MPKMKTVSSAKKRFTLTATGKIKKTRFQKSYFDEENNKTET